MQIDPVVALVVGGIVAAIPTVIGWFTKRSIDALDRSIEGLGKKVEALNGDHTNLLVEVTKLQGEVALLSATKADK